MKRMMTIFVGVLVALAVVVVAAQRSVAQSQDDVYVMLQTTQGDIQLKLYPGIAPKTVENFVGHVNNGYYNGLIFHRVIPNFMIQGGDPTGTGTGGESIWGGKFGDEINPSVTFSRPGMLAMANAGPNTNGSQFFITTVPTPWLNGKHTIFGEVVSGITVVKAIESVPTAQGNKPRQRQEIFNAYVIE